MTEFAGKEVASAYDEWAISYEAVENATRDLAAKVLRQQPINLRDRRILEIGCGTGLNTRYLAQHSRHVVAMDFSAGMLAQARANVSAPNVRFLQGDIQQEWPVEANSIDVIVCMLVLEHLKKLDHVFQQASRGLRTGGEFFVCELHPYKQLQGLQAKFTEGASGKTVLVQAFFHDVSDYVNAGIQSGLQLIRLEEWRDPQHAAANKDARIANARPDNKEFPQDEAARAARDEKAKAPRLLTPHLRK